ncbi:MAG: MinD/ParA family protein [Actinomycetota bacterium]|nr:MinD/ParA family protein [Actinomycetota bacterium]
MELPSDRATAYHPPGPYEQAATWDGPSAYQSASDARPSPSAGPNTPAGPPPAVDVPPPVAGWSTPLGNPGLHRLPAANPGPGQFDARDLLPPRQQAPTSGIRRVLHRLSGGHLNLGPSASDQAHQQLVDRARTPAVTGRRRIAMVSLKGGVGKTTTTVMLGHTLATVRGDNVIAIDANPDAGNLASRIRRQTDRSARDLLNASETLQRYADVRSFTSQADSRLEVLAGESDPALSEAFSASDYEAVLAALERFYSIVLTDCGTGILHDAMRAVLWYVDQLIVVTSPAIDSAHALGQLLDWLDQHGYHHLVANGIVAVNGVRKRSDIRVEQFAATFGPRCRGVVTVPYDAGLSTGGESSLQAMAPSTQRAYLELAAAVGDGFSQPRLHGHDPGVGG